MAEPVGVASEETTGTARDESTATLLNQQQEAWFANIKHRFDELLKDSSQQAQNAQISFQSAANQHQRDLAAINGLTIQAMQNAITTSNNINQSTATTIDMAAKAAIKASEVALDGLWNPVQQGAGDTLTARGVNLDDPALKSIGVAAAQGAQAALNPLIAILQQIVDRLTKQPTA